MLIATIMRSIIISSFIKNATKLCRPLRNNNALIREYTAIISNKELFISYPLQFSSVACRYSNDNKKHFITLEKKSKAGVLEHSKQKIKDTEQRIRQRSEEIVKDIRYQKTLSGQKFREKKDHIIKDILETKAKVKERLEEVTEKENIFTVPNVLCMTRIIMSPYLGYIIIQEDYNVAFGLLVFAGVTDLLDGWIARNWKGQSTKMGSFLDPMADKVLIATLFISLTYQNLIPLALTMLIVGRDVALVVAAFIIRYMSLPSPRTLSRYFDVTHATVQLAPTFISKVNTAVQLLLVGTTLAAPVFGYVDHPALQALCGVTAASTVVSAISYLVSKDTYKFIKRKS